VESGEERKGKQSASATKCRKGLNLSAKKRIHSKTTYRGSVGQGDVQGIGTRRQGGARENDLLSVLKDRKIREGNSGGE